MPSPTQRQGDGCSNDCSRLAAGLSILLVEPSRTQAAIIRKLLVGQGLEDVEAVTTGNEALQSMRSRARQVVVCALHLADMTGLQLADKIRAENKTGSVGLVLISSEAESQDVGSLSRLGKAILLKKPFTAAQLGDVSARLRGAHAAVRDRWLVFRQHQHWYRSSRP